MHVYVHLSRDWGIAALSGTLRCRHSDSLLQHRTYETQYTMHGIMKSSQNSKHSKSHQAVTLTTNIMYYWIVILQKTITFFPKSLFLLRIPSNINQSTVGLFWLSNNKQIQAIYKIKVHWKYVFVNILLSILVHIFFYIIIFLHILLGIWFP